MFEKEKHDTQNLIDRAAEESLLSRIVYYFYEMMWKLETCDMCDRLNKVEHQKEYSEPKSEVHAG